MRVASALGPLLAICAHVAWANNEFTELGEYVVTSAANTGCPLYQASPGSRADLVSAAELRGCVFQSRKGDPKALSAVANAPDKVLIQATTSATKHARAASQVKEHFDGVLVHGGKLGSFRALAASNDYSGLRAEYGRVQPQGSQASKAVILMSNGEIDALVNEERIAVAVKDPDLATLEAISKVTRPTVQTISSETSLRDIASRLFRTASKPYVDLLAAANPRLAANVGPGGDILVMQNSQLVVPSVPGKDMVVMVAPRDNLTVEGAVAAINLNERARSESVERARMEIPITGVLQDVTVSRFADGGERWYVNAMGAAQIEPGDLAFAQNPARTVVGIVDGGLETTHPALQDVLWRLPKPLSSADWPEGSVGYDLFRGEADPSEEAANSHGTHVAGLVTGRRLAAWMPFMESAGLPKSIAVFAFKITGKDRHFDFTAAQDAIRMGLRKNILLFNLSFSGPDSGMLRDLIGSEDHRDRTLFVVAAGNGLGNVDQNPKQHKAFRDPPLGGPLRNALFVAALDDKGNVAEFSGYSAEFVHIAAPGVEIASTVRGETFGRLSGTSMAAPLVTMAAAMLKSMNPNEPMLAIKDRILGTCDYDVRIAGLVRNGCKLNLLKAILKHSDIVETSEGNLLRGDVDATQFAMVQAPRKLSRIWVEGKPDSAMAVTPGIDPTRVSLRDQKVTIRLRAGQACPGQTNGTLCVLEPQGIRDVVFRMP